MRLLHRLGDNTFALTADLKQNLPDYAILSHTWLLDDEEVSFEDIKNRDAQRKEASYNKLRFCGDLAARDGLKYFWVDTCCIDQSSSQELQEAITRMFGWYQNATKCYVYLEDVVVTEEQLSAPESLDYWKSAFYNSRWFTRGWTLQELLAPVSVEFYSTQVARLGDKRSLQQWIHEITKIPLSALQGEDLSNFSVSERFSWAEGRQTGREEDKAYSLLGLFTIFMPLIYGEGEDRAINRLKDEIEKGEAGISKSDNILDTLPKTPQAAFNSLENQHGPTCLGNTRAELLEGISDWVEGSNETSIYWLNGIAGTGKSTIARTIARKYHDRGNLGGSFFFSKIGGVNNAERFFTTFAWQLANRIPAARRHICDALMGYRDVAYHSLRDQWEQLIIQPLTKLRSDVSSSVIMLVVDALDECESDQDIRIILRLLATAQSLNNIHLRVFITSRPEIPMRIGFSQIPEIERQVFLLHDIPAELVNRDLTIFFEKNFEDLKQERGLPADWSGMQYITQLVELSCGLFIWASTACRYIREGKRLALKRIQNLVGGQRSSAAPEKRLDEIYTTVLVSSIHEDFDEDEKQEVYRTTKSILGSIAVFLSPLSTKALASLLNIDTADVVETLADWHTILNIPDQRDQQIRLHHPSFREFLLNKERCADMNFWVDEKEAHKAVAENCIDIMSKMLKRNICGFSSPSIRAKDIDLGLGENCISPELQYACMYWAEHYRRSGTLLKDDDRASRFFKAHYLHWLEAMNIMGKSSDISAIIRMYESLLTVPENPIQIPFIRDARKFFYAFDTIMEKTPLQVYCSALIFIPFTNTLKPHFQTHLHPWFKHVLTIEADVPEAKEEWNYVNDIVFTPDGRYIASGSVNEIARVWDVTTKAPFRTFTGQLDKICSLAISPDGTMIAAGSDDSSIMAWDMNNGSILYHLTDHTRWVNALHFSPDGRLLVSGSMDETILVYDAITGKLLKTLDAAKSCVNGLAFAPDGKLIASATVDKLVRLWSINDYEITTIFDGHSGPINNVRFSPSGNEVASASDDLTVKIWNVNTGRDVHTLRGHRKRVMAVNYSPSGLLVASGSEDKAVMLWNANTGAHIMTLTGSLSGINGVTYSPDGTLLASGSFDDNINFWDAETGESRGKLIDFEKGTAPEPPTNGHLDEPKSDQNGSIDVSEPYLNGKKGSKGHSSTINSVIFSPDGGMVASGSEDSTIKLWTRAGTELHQLKGHAGGVVQLTFSSDSRLLASSSMDQTIAIWNVSTGSLINRFKAHSGDINHCQFSMDNSWLVSCSADKTVVLWDITEGVALQTFTGHSGAVNSVLISPQKNTIASCSTDMTIKLWRTDLADTLFTLEGHSDGVNAIAFSSDQHFLVSGSADTTLRLWHLGRDELCGVARGHTLPVNSVTISHDDKRIVSCSDDSTVRIWDVETQALLHVLQIDVVVRSVSFRVDDQLVVTDRGTLNMSLTPLGSSPSKRSHFALFVTDEWVKKDNEEVLWIPENYRATSVATWDGTAVLGLSTGSVVFAVLH